MKNFFIHTLPVRHGTVRKHRIIVASPKKVNIISRGSFSDESSGTNVWYRTLRIGAQSYGTEDVEKTQVLSPRTLRSVQTVQIKNSTTIHNTDIVRTYYGNNTLTCMVFRKKEKNYLSHYLFSSKKIIETKLTIVYILLERHTV